MKNYTSSPAASPPDWMVWDMYEDLPPKPIFIGSMEDCGAVADAKNEQLRIAGDSAAHPKRRE